MNQSQLVLLFTVLTLILISCTDVRSPSVLSAKRLSGACSVLSRSLLAGFELFHVPAANGQVTLVLVHAVGKTLDVGGTWASGFGRGGRLRVKVVVHGSAILGI